MNVLRRAAGHATNRLLHASADNALRAAATVLNVMPFTDPMRYGVRLHRNVAYKPTGLPEHRLDVYEPLRRAEPRPVVFYVHGGGFAMLSKETHRVMALGFAARGYLVVNVEYRKTRAHPFPTPLEDAADALLFAKANVARWGGDPHRIALAGESAGGNLTLALAVATRVPRPEPVARKLFGVIKPRAVLPIYGMLDLVDLDRLRRHRSPRPHVWAQIEHAASSYLGDHVRERSLASPLASPLRIVESLTKDEARHLPPFFIACGTRDPLLDDSRRLAAALEGLGHAPELVVHPGEIHGYNAMIWRPAAKDMWRRANRFLKTHLVPSADDLGSVVSAAADFR